MKDELISFETAKLAKEKGFDILCSYCYRDDIRRELNFMSSSPRNNTSLKEAYYTTYAVSTQSLLQRWLREVHNIFIGVEIRLDRDANKITYLAHILKIPYEPYTGRFYGINSITYEEALEAGLLEVLKLI